MEFNGKIIRAGIENEGEALKREGRFIQTKEQLLAYDYTEMNRLLSGFLDRLAESYEIIY